MVDFSRAHPHLDAIVTTFDLAYEPIDLHLRRLNGGLDHGALHFGKRYRAVQSFQANRLGAVQKGETVHFLGYYVFPYDNGLRLFFERRDSRKLVLEFEGNAAEAPDRVRMIFATNLHDYFAPMLFDFSKRTKRLSAARAVIQHHLDKLL